MFIGTNIKYHITKIQIKETAQPEIMIKCHLLWTFKLKNGEKQEMDVSLAIFKDISYTFITQ